MANLNETYNVTDLPKGTNYEVLPEGWYTSTINGAEIRNTKAGNGQYIAAQYSITGPTHQGRVVFGNLNIKNPSAKAEEIGRQQLGDLMRAIGLSSVSDTDQLIGGQLNIKLTINKSEQYGDRNDVTGYKALSGGVSFAPKPTNSFKTEVALDKPAPPWAAK